MLVVFLFESLVLLKWVSLVSTISVGSTLIILISTLGLHERDVGVFAYSTFMGETP